MMSSEGACILEVNPAPAPMPVAMSEAPPMPIPAIPSYPDWIEKDVILVYEGDFTCMDGSPIKFDRARLERIARNMNNRFTRLAEEFGAVENIPIGAYPPFQEDHEDSSTGILGRVTGLLIVEKRDIPKVGKNLWCIRSRIRILGQENVQRVLDGRIYNVSPGVDDNTDMFDEVSSVCFGAAEGAALLSKPKTAVTVNMGGSRVGKKLKAQRAESLKQLQALRDSSVHLSRKLVQSSETLKMARSEAFVDAKLRLHMRAGKLTPAEYKKMAAAGDLKKMAKLTDEARDMLLSTYDNREPVIQPQQAGTSSAEPLADIAQATTKKKLAKLKSNALKDMGRAVPKDLAEAAAGAVIEAPAEVPGVTVTIEGPSAKLGTVVKDHLARMRKCMASGDTAAVEKCMSEFESESTKEMSAGGADSIPPQGFEEKIRELETSITELQVLCTKMGDELLKIMKSEEEAELGAEDGEGEGEADMAAGGDKPGEGEGEGKPKELGAEVPKPGDSKELAAESKEKPADAAGDDDKNKGGKTTDEGGAKK